MQGRVECIEARQLGFLVAADAPDGLKVKTCRDDRVLGAEQQEEGFAADGEEVDAVLRTLELRVGREQLALVLAHEYLAVAEIEDDAIILWGGIGLVLVVEAFRCDILNHEDIPF